jgi:hypothetical protein
MTTQLPPAPCRRPNAVATLAAVALGALVLAGCAAPKPTLRSDYDRSANFATYRTYAYANPVGTDKAGYSSIITQHFKNAIDAEMSARGYRKVESDPDLLVNFHANATEKVDVRSTPTPTMGMGVGYGGYYGYRGSMYAAWPMYTNDVSTVRYQVGTLNVDVVDARRKQLVWEGVAEGKLRKETMQNPEPAIRSVINQLYQSYPGRATPAQ